MNSTTGTTVNATTQTLTAPRAYGPCEHPAIYQKDGRWYCTECQQLRATQQTTPMISLETRLELARIAIDVACERHLDGVVQEPAYAAPVRATRYGQQNKILESARLTLLTKGWHQRGYEGMGGQLCALGAIDRNACNGPVRSEATELLMNRIAELHGARYRSIWAWNDDQDTTLDDVLDLLY